MSRFWTHIQNVSLLEIIGKEGILSHSFCQCHLLLVSVNPQCLLLRLKVLCPRRFVLHCRRNEKEFWRTSGFSWKSPKESHLQSSLCQNRCHDMQSSSSFPGAPHWEPRWSCCTEDTVLAHGKMRGEHIARTPELVLTSKALSWAPNNDPSLLHTEGKKYRFYKMWPTRAN